MRQTILNTTFATSVNKNESRRNGRMNKKNIPIDAQGYVDGSYYKIGLHGKAYRWTGKEWIISTRHPKVLLSLLDRKFNPFTEE